MALSNKEIPIDLREHIAKTFFPDMRLLTKLTVWIMSKR